MKLTTVEAVSHYQPKIARRSVMKKLLMATVALTAMASFSHSQETWWTLNHSILIPRTEESECVQSLNSPEEINRLIPTGPLYHLNPEWVENKQNNSVTLWADNPGGAYARLPATTLYRSKSDCLSANNIRELSKEEIQRIVEEKVEKFCTDTRITTMAYGTQEYNANSSLTGALWRKSIYTVIELDKSSIKTIVKDKDIFCSANVIIRWKLTPG